MAALERVTEATAQLEARAEATQLRASSTSSTSSAVENQLAALRAEIAGTAPAKELGAAPSA